MNTIGIISDTHGLLRPEALEALDDCKLIIHAGDVGSPHVLAALEQIAPVFAVRGNVDRDAWALRLPETRVVEIEHLLLYLLHDLGTLDLDPRAAGFRVVVFGHSHQPSVSEKQGVLYVNPGAAGPRRFRLPITLAKMRIEAGDPAVEIVTLRE
ncbi:MAG: metallophosphoesterase family protein [Thermoguttaceae bacterium]|jgi:putative phosphoesterase